MAHKLFTKTVHSKFLWAEIVWPNMSRNCKGRKCYGLGRMHYDVFGSHQVDHSKRISYTNTRKLTKTTTSLNKKQTDRHTGF